MTDIVHETDPSVEVEVSFLSLFATDAVIWLRRCNRASAAIVETFILWVVCRERADTALTSFGLVRSAVLSYL